jgi:hypothetical protein
MTVMFRNAWILEPVQRGRFWTGDYTGADHNGENRPNNDGINYLLEDSLVRQ